MTEEKTDTASPQNETPATGLSEAEAARRLAQYGENVLAESHVSAFARLARFFWGPIPWMIEVAALLSAVVRHWEDLAIILAMLVINAAVGFWQEFEADNAIQLLKQRLALKARVMRDGVWKDVAASQLVPGDRIALSLGAIIPADVKLTGGDYLSVDQSALTGESLPVDKKVGDVAYSGSIARLGEMTAVVTATGMSTYFGKTAKLVQQAQTVSHFQRAVLRIGNFLILTTVGLVATIALAALFRHDPLVETIQFALILTVASIPVALPAVLSVTMAVGAERLARMKAIVSRLVAIEEMAGMDILCSDKTGTLTKNELTLGDPSPAEGVTRDDLLTAAALASRRDAPDAIDGAILAGLADAKALDAWQVTAFRPFDPVNKRAEADVEKDGRSVSVAKGAPQVIVDLCKLDPERQKAVAAQVDADAGKGLRTLGVARTDESGAWRFLGLLALFDPPRDDSAATIAATRAMGVDVKMVTGDHEAIARQIAGRLSLGTDIVVADTVFGESMPADPLPAIEAADGFARVFPEHKFKIVKALQGGGHIVGMTGDGVNDAPALKQADVGIAVSGATDAARAAAALILTAPGLSVIINAVEEARRIFERMNSYAIYRIVETIRIMFFVVLAMIVFNFYPITAIMIILLALFNDLPIMSIAYDDTWLDPKPVRWDMHRVLVLSTVLGIIGVVETFGILWIAKEFLHLTIGEIQTFIFLKLAVAGHLTLFVARTRRPLWSRPFPSPLLFWSAIVTKAIATLFVVFPFGLISAISWANVALIWAYCIVWIFIEDQAKLAVYRHLDAAGPRHRTFLGITGIRLHPHAR